MYKYYCEKSNIEYNPIINNKNAFELNDNYLKFIDKVYEKYKVIKINENKLYDFDTDLFII